MHRTVVRNPLGAEANSRELITAQISASRDYELDMVLLIF